ncbi:hypothetical protein [Streptomyces sp. NPDC127033]|uniref:hypothetical protein n=1 Tax=Streptomyces sp. NPDC127033 TaxID=3347110 RepID=UPI00364C6CFC
MLGYLRMLPGMDDLAADFAISRIRELAEAEGFVLGEVFVEYRWLRCDAQDALVEYCLRHQVCDVVVPSTSHLHTVPSLAFVAQVALQESMGGLVRVAHLTDEEAASIRTLLDARPL